MIERYSRKEVKKIWEEKNKDQIWLDIERAATQGMEKLGYIPKGISSKIRKRNGNTTLLLNALVLIELNAS